MAIFKISNSPEIKIELAMILSRKYRLCPYYFNYPRASQDNSAFFDVEIANKENKWQSFNLAKKKCLFALKENSEEIKEYLTLHRDKKTGLDKKR